MRYNIYENGGAVEGLVTISGMTVTGYIRLRHNPVENAEAASKQYVDSLLVLLDSNSVKQGVFNKERLPTFTGGQVTSVAGNNVLTIAPTGVAPNTYTKITVGVNGLVTSGSNLTPDDIWSISFSKITTGKPTTLAGYGITDSVSRVSGAITGNLTLNGAPIAATDVATKQYTDNKILNDKTYQTGDLITGSYDTPPTGFLRCNGGEVSKTTYAALYGVLGDVFDEDLTFGSGKPWVNQYHFNTTQSAILTPWTVEQPLPVPRSGSSLVVTKNRVYLLGGVESSSGGNLNTIYSSVINPDGTLGEWVSSGTLPIPLAVSQAVVNKDKVYLIGGYNSDKVFISSINPDGTLGSWSEGPVLPKRVHSGQAIITKSKIYLLGGADGTYLRDVYFSNINQDGSLSPWTAHFSLPVGFNYSQAIVTKHRVYLLGGFNGSSFISTVYSATIDVTGTLSSWSSSGSLPRGTHATNVAVTANRVYMLGGWGSSGVSVDNRSAPINADGTIGEWSSDTVLPVPTHAGSVLVTSSKIYLIGGWNNSGVINTIMSASFSGGNNDYSSYYNGLIGAGGGTGFRLPDYTSTTDPVGKVFVKF